MWNQAAGTRQQQARERPVTEQKPNPAPCIQLENLPGLLLQSLPTTRGKQGVESDLFTSYAIRTLLQGIRGKEKGERVSE